RRLEPAERDEMKAFTRNADALTPLLKLFSSESCNQIAYDALQIHGGTGYMKDFPIERLTRDARITSIYEGTSQLQVVAAMRFVGNGIYLKMMQDFEAQEVKAEFEFLKNILVKMTDQYSKTVDRVQALNDTEYFDFHSRRLVEMAGNVIIGYLLLNDANRNNKFSKSAEIFIRLGRSENIQKVSFINNTNLKDLSGYKL
ncbi:MAG: Acyl-CoA dehydrogenase C-terminal domain-containing protein, partial [Bacteroidota bacterium]|nr:Acyl-CoA dehydrogenase C-terminal domain-containing protein [Bacteroidota bacterium]